MSFLIYAGELFTQKVGKSRIIYFYSELEIIQLNKRMNKNALQSPKTITKFNFPRE